MVPTSMSEQESEDDPDYGGYGWGRAAPIDVSRSVIHGAFIGTLNDANVEKGISTAIRTSVNFSKFSNAFCKTDRQLPTAPPTPGQDSQDENGMDQFYG